MKDIKRLPDSELNVMQALWSFDRPAARSEIERITESDHPMAPTTLLTLLSRLTEKGFVNTEKEGRSGLYSAAVSKEDYLASQSMTFVKQVCSGSISAFANALCDSGLTKEELNELKEYLERNTK